MKWTDPTARVALILCLSLAGASAVAHAQADDVEATTPSGELEGGEADHGSEASEPGLDAPPGQAGAPANRGELLSHPEAAGEPASSGVVEFEPGDGVTLRSDDDQFRLNIGLRGQFLGQLDAPSGGDVSAGLALRRARLDFVGHIFGPHNRFDVELALSPDDLDWTDATGPTFTPLLDYTMTFDYLRDLTVVVGARKMPFSRERLISSGDLAMIDRSAATGALELNRDFGVWLRSDDLFGAGFLRYWVGISSGEGRDGLIGDDADFAYMARVEVLPLGLFDSYLQADLQRHASPRLAFGLAYVYLDDSPWVDGLDGQLPEDGGTTDTHAAAFDAVFFYEGFSAEIDVLFRYGERNPGVAGPVTAASNGAGGFAQVGYLLPDTFVEITARYSMTMGIGEVTSFEDRGELGGAVSLYFQGHALKLQLDYFHLWGQMSEFTRGAEQVRLQLQGTL